MSIAVDLIFKEGQGSGLFRDTLNDKRQQFSWTAKSAKKLFLAGRR
jgi:hypothetical protein